MRDDARSLVCPDCGATYDAGPDEPWRCTCGSPLEFDWTPDPPAEPNIDSREGLWAFRDLLPVAPRVTFDEQWTPLADAPAWSADFKLDYTHPSGSFKDRGATATLSRAAELGVERVVEDSSGNAGAAVAQYAARAGVDADIYVPADAKPSKLRAIEAAGATPVRVEGSRQDVTDACVAAVEDGDAWYASHAWNPAFFAGTSTFAFELAAQRDWDIPDAIVLPLGHGTLFLGAYRGFSLLRDAGWTAGIPRLLGVQAAGVSPIADALHGPRGGANDVADGIQIEQPVRGAEIRRAIEATGGDAIAVTSEETDAALDRLHARGFYVEPTSAAGPAGLRRYRDRGVLDEGDDVVVPLTGSGLKA
ncbi:pyridoxal-phosphate dependent enzyme [Halocalculus aciditolerans]|uniref:Threonine synthase n=1 Tax=Halocalculus aciditolerans TaxID=1383812 RepID=A0A830F0E0_9EURY|nr:pyridoxal-phosphate dependent enzyme [Halocalculus aciditolerans]GGL48812.1 threonine synthase [Halocalculus aciditolerans]